MNNEQIASQLSEAIVAVLNDHKAKATKLVANALRDLTSGNDAPMKMVKRTTGTGRGPALSGDKLAAFNVKATDGVTSHTQLAREFGVTYAVAHRYATLARRLAQAASQANHPSNR